MLNSKNKTISQSTTQWHQVLLLLFVWVLALGSFQRSSFSNLHMLLPQLPEGAVYVHDIIIAVWVGVIFSSKSRLKNIVSTIHNHWQFIILFFWITLATLLHSTTLLSSGLLYIARLVIYLVFAGGLAQLDKEKKIDLSQALVVFFSVYIVASLFIYIFFPDLRFLKILGWDDHYYRLTGTLLDPNFSGVILAWANLTITHTFLHRKKIAAQRIYIAGFVVSLVALALTFSRSSYLAWFIGAIVLTYLKKKHTISYLYLPTAIIILSSTLILAPKPGGEGVNILRTSTIASRLSTAQNELDSKRTVLQHLLGSGFTFEKKQTHQLYQNKQHAVFPDNIIILIYQSIGSLGILYLLFLCKQYWSEVATHATLWPYITVILIHSIFNNTLLQPVVFLVFILLVNNHKRFDQKKS